MKNTVKRLWIIAIAAVIVFSECDDGNNTLKPVPVSGISLNENTLELTVGETETLTATVAPADATNKDVSWNSSNTGVATVNNGTVSALAAGSATITVTTADGGKTAQCAVTVQTAGGPITSPTGIEMVHIPAGTFIMGSPTTESGRGDDETQHSVTLTKSFYMGKYQVTQEQYQAVMGSNPSNFTSAVTGESGTPGKLPVEKVSWYDALVFCNKLSMMEELAPVYSIGGSTDPADWGAVPFYDEDTKGIIGDKEVWDAAEMDTSKNGYRLPTEAEWEYACRAGTTTAFNNGNDDYTDDASVGEVAWYDNNSESKTHQVGLKKANAFGLYDMHGNMLEWCWDWYWYYPSEAQTDPVGWSMEKNRVFRGGVCAFSADYARSAFRGYNFPEVKVFGFRLVRSSL